MKQPNFLNSHEYVIRDGIYDFLGDCSDNEYFEDFEILTKERNNKSPMESHIIANCLEFAMKTDFFNSKLLDIGSGNGDILRKLPVDFQNKFACDSSLNRLKAVPEKYWRIRANGEETPFKIAYFDVVVCTDVFEHVLEPEKLVGEISRVLKPGGSLFFSVPWEQDLSVLDSEEYKKQYKVYSCRHRRSVNEEIISCYFNGFEQVSHTSIDVIRQFMKFKPYSIRLFHFIRKK